MESVILTVGTGDLRNLRWTLQRFGFRSGLPLKESAVGLLRLFAVRIGFLAFLTLGVAGTVAAPSAMVAGLIGLWALWWAHKKKAIEHHLVCALQEQRYVLARDLHDTVGTMLASISKEVSEHQSPAVNEAVLRAMEPLNELVWVSTPSSKREKSPRIAEKQDSVAGPGTKNPGMLLATISWRTKAEILSIVTKIVTSAARSQGNAASGGVPLFDLDEGDLQGACASVDPRELRFVSADPEDRVGQAVLIPIVLKPSGTTIWAKAEITESGRNLESLLHRAVAKCETEKEPRRAAEGHQGGIQMSISVRAGFGESLEAVQKMQLKQAPPVAGAADDAASG